MEDREDDDPITIDVIEDAIRKSSQEHPAHLTMSLRKCKGTGGNGRECTIKLAYQLRTKPGRPPFVPLERILKVRGRLRPDEQRSAHPARKTRARTSDQASPGDASLS